MHQADAAALVSKQDKIFAEHLNQLGPRTEFRRQRHRVPEPPQILAARRVRTNLGQLGIALPNPCLVIAAIGNVLLRPVSNGIVHGCGSEVFGSKAAKTRPAPLPHREALRRASASDPALATVTRKTGNGAISVSPAALWRRGGARMHPPIGCAEAAHGATPCHGGYGTTFRTVANLTLNSGKKWEVLKNSRRSMRIDAPQAQISDDIGLLSGVYPYPLCRVPPAATRPFAGGARDLDLCVGSRPFGAVDCLQGGLVQQTARRKPAPIGGVFDTPPVFPGCETIEGGGVAAVEFAAYWGAG